MKYPGKVALDVPTVKSASFRQRQPGDGGYTEPTWTGVVYDESTGIEFDVREDGHSWNVNDDDGRNFRSFSLKRALRKAIAANQ